MLPEFNIVQSITSWILYYYHKCKTSSFDNSISYVEEEMDFQLGSILLVKSCRNASHSYASRTNDCIVYYILNSVFVSSLQNQFFNDSISCEIMQNFQFCIYLKWNQN